MWFSNPKPLHDANLDVIKHFIHITYLQCSQGVTHSLLIFIIFVIFLISSCPGLLASVSTSAHSPLFLLPLHCNIRYTGIFWARRAVTILLAANTFSSRFFDENCCQIGFTFPPVYSMCVQRSNSFACIFFTSPTAGVVAAKRSLDSGGR